MREISAKTITEMVKKLCIEANCVPVNILLHSFVKECTIKAGAGRTERGVFGMMKLKE